jgi:NTE family protein
MSGALGLVLSGGGANGAFAAGVYAAVEEAGLSPTILSGTSAGALNAAGLAAGMDAATLGALWRSISARDVYRLRRDVWSFFRPRGLLRSRSLPERALHSIGWTHLLETAVLRRTLVRALGGERVPVRDGLRIAVSAVEVATGQLVRFANVLPPAHRMTPRFREVDLDVDHLMASSAIPLAFAPGTVAGVEHWDGGLVANTPLAPALAYEPDRVIVVTSSTRTRPATPPASLAEAIALLIDNVLAYSLDADLQRAELVNELARVGPPRADRRRVDLLLVEPVGLDLGGSLDFDPALAERRLALGLRAGREALEGWA